MKILKNSKRLNPLSVFKGVNRQQQLYGSAYRATDCDNNTIRLDGHTFIRIPCERDLHITLRVSYYRVSEFIICKCNDGVGKPEIINTTLSRQIKFMTECIRCVDRDPSEILEPPPSSCGFQSFTGSSLLTIPLLFRGRRPMRVFHVCRHQRPVAIRF